MRNSNIQTYKLKFRSLVIWSLAIIWNLVLGVWNFDICYAAVNKQEQKLSIEAGAAVDKTPIQIGDKIIYTITVKTRDGIEIEFPQFLPENLAGFAIKDFGSSEKGVFRKKTFKQWYLLDTYVSGEHIIPAAVVKYRRKGQTDWQEIDVKEIKIEVKSVLDTTSAQKDIRDIRGPKSFADRIWLYLVIVLCILLITGLVFSIVSLRKKKLDYQPLPLPAHLIAYEALSVLEKKDYIHKGQTKAYYVELSDIVRQYLENRFNIRAPEMTTEEFLIKVKEDSILSSEHKGLLRDFLVNCDLVKFARYQPAEQEANLSFASAKRLIDQTKEQ